MAAAATSTADEIATFCVSGKEVIISQADYDRVIEHRWYLWDGYVHNKKLGYLHVFIIGKRPDDVPESFVIDHKNRKPLDNSQPNLRFVSKSFNSWNVMTQHRSSSRFKGVLHVKATGKWRATFLKKFIGQNFGDERSAAKAVAKAAIKEWPVHAIDSDLLVGEDLLTHDEIRQIQEEIESEDCPLPRELPRGVSYCTRDKVYLTQYRGKYLGRFATAEAAQAVYDKHRHEKDQEEWANFCNTPVTLDTDGNAIIALSGQKGVGKYALVPIQIWHQLTYKHKWNIGNKGYALGSWEGRPMDLHRVIYGLLHPDFDKKLTVDHCNSESKLDNRESNLRLATLSVQNSNKNKTKKSCSSMHVGVTCNTRGQWFGSFRYESVQYTTKIFRTEDQAVEALRVKEVEVKGVYARM